MTTKIFFDVSGYTLFSKYNITVVYNSILTPTLTPEQISPLFPTGQVKLLINVVKFWHSCSIHTLFVSHLVPSLTSPGFSIPEEGCTPYELHYSNKFELLQKLCLSVTM